MYKIIRTNVRIKKIYQLKVEEYHGSSIDQWNYGHRNLILEPYPTTDI